MSIRVMSLVWDNFPRGGSDKLVMLAMADWCNDQGGSLHPSVATVARKVCVSEKQARVILHKLIDEGYLTVIGNENGGNPGASRQYIFNIKKLSTPPVEVTHPVEVTPPVEVRDPSRGGAFTPPAGGSLTTIDPSINTSGVSQAKPASKKFEKGITLKTFLGLCKANGEKAIPEDDPVYEYATKAGICDEMLAVAWHEFKSYWLTGEGKSKRKSDWRKTYRNAIKQNRAKLWFIRDGDAAWTTVGMQAKRTSA